MKIWESIILGLIQGLCEFLPVSSSGHLVLFERLLGVHAPGLLLETLLHVGTLIAVVVVFRRDLLAMLKNPLGKEVRQLVVATIPTVLAAIFLSDWIDQAFTGAFLGISFILTTAILWAGSFVKGEKREVGYPNAVSMGMMQVVALLPGVSRSGSTISGGLFSGLTREAAARFSFLMSVPAILGSMALQIVKLLRSELPGDISWLPMLLSALIAAVAGVFAIRIMLRVIRKKGLFWFGLYTLLLGVFVIIDQNITHLIF